MKLSKFFIDRDYSRNTASSGVRGRFRTTGKYLYRGRKRYRGQMHQPVTININPGPFHGEMLTRVQTVLSKTIESEGLDSYHLNATTERYKCENAGWLDCESGWKSFTLG